MKGCYVSKHLRYANCIKHLSALHKRDNSIKNNFVEAKNVFTYGSYFMHLSFCLSLQCHSSHPCGIHKLTMKNSVTPRQNRLNHQIIIS